MEEISTCIPGVKSIEQLMSNVGASQIKFTDDELKRVEEIQQIIGYDYGTTSSNIRDFRKPPAGRFTILRRKRKKESNTSDSNEYCIVVDTLGR